MKSIISSWYSITRSSQFSTYIQHLLNTKFCYFVWSTVYNDNHNSMLRCVRIFLSKTRKNVRPQISFELIQNPSLIRYRYVRDVCHNRYINHDSYQNWKYNIHNYLLIDIWYDNTVKFSAHNRPSRLKFGGIQIPKIIGWGRYVILSHYCLWHTYYSGQLIQLLVIAVVCWVEIRFSVT